MAVTTKNKKKFELPHVYTIAFLLIILFALLTWVVPSGQFERQTVQTAAGEREVAIAGTYHEVPKTAPDGVNLRQGVFEVLQAPTQGIQAAADVVAFVLLIGGSFALITKTNAINAGVSHVIKKLGGRDLLLIPVIMILFSIGGTTFGMSEEALPFYAIFLPIIMGLGYDSMTAFMICFLGPNMGYIGSTVNPFNVLIAQGLIQVNGNPQLWLRAIFYVIFVAAGIIFVMRYAMRVKANPELSVTFLDDKSKRQEFSVVNMSDVDIPFTGRQKLVLVSFFVGMATIVWGLVTQGWYMNEISAVFFAMGLAAGILGGLSEKEMAEEFVRGMGEFVYAAVIIGVARGILVVAENGMIIDTILNALASLLSGMPTAAFTTILYFVEGFLSLLVPSSSGLAALTIPVLGPLTDLVGVNPEAAVTALTVANQTMNTISPVAGMTVAGLAVCKISFPQWWKTCWKFMIVITLIGLVDVAISGMLPL